MEPQEPPPPVSDGSSRRRRLVPLGAGVALVCALLAARAATGEEPPPLPLVLGGLAGIAAILVGGYGAPVPRSAPPADSDDAHAEDLDIDDWVT